MDRPNDEGWKRLVKILWGCVYRVAGGLDPAASQDPSADYRHAVVRFTESDCKLVLGHGEIYKSLLL